MRASDFLRDLQEAIEISGPSAPVEVGLDGLPVDGVSATRGIVLVTYIDSERSTDELLTEIGDKDEKNSGVPPVGR